MTAPERGRLIALEGIDGSGKSTQAELLGRALGALVTREPGGSALGRMLRDAVLDPRSVAPSERAEALLLAADRAQHVDEVLVPALEGGRWVVTDRYAASTLAYQGYGRGLELASLAQLEGFATHGLKADLTVLVDVPAEVARGRRTRGDDRMEGLGDAFLGRVRAGYLALADKDPDRWSVVDGTRSVDDVGALVRAVVRERLGR